MRGVLLALIPVEGKEKEGEGQGREERGGEGKGEEGGGFGRERRWALMQSQ